MYRLTFNLLPLLEIVNQKAGSLLVSNLANVFYYFRFQFCILLYLPRDALHVCA